MWRFLLGLSGRARVRSQLRQRDFSLWPPADFSGEPGASGSGSPTIAAAMSFRCGVELAEAIRYANRIDSSTNPGADSSESQITIILPLWSSTSHPTRVRRLTLLLGHPPAMPRSPHRKPTWLTVATRAITVAQAAKAHVNKAFRFAIVAGAGSNCVEHVRAFDSSGQLLESIAVPWRIDAPVSIRGPSWIPSDLELCALVS